MQTAIDIIKKVFDFLGGINYAEILDKIEAALIKLVEWIASVAA